MPRVSHLSDFTEPPHASLGEWLHRAGRLMRDRLAAELKAAGHDYPIEFWPTLKLLARRDGVCQEDIAAFLVRDKATAARLLGRMESANLVARRRDPGNRRRKRVSLTPAGRSVHAELRACAARVHREAVGSVEADRLAACAEVLARVFDNLHAPVAMPSSSPAQAPTAEPLTATV